MSESEILPFQDATGDGLNDACDDVLKVIPPKDCPKCIPNSGALVLDWKEKGKYEPFLNEKRCMYQVTVGTKHKTTFGALPYEKILEEDEDGVSEILDSIYEEYIYIAIEALLEYYNKANTHGTQKLVYAMIEKTDWHLGLRATNRLKLLYSVPSEEFDAIPADPEEDEEDESGNLEASFDIEELLLLLIQVRKGLWMYGRNLKVYRKIENANLLFLVDNSVFNLDEYGDWGLRANASRMAKLLTELDTFLNKKGFNLQGGGSFLNKESRNRPVQRLTFAFSKIEQKYELKKLTIEASGCESEPIEFTKKLSILKRSGSMWTDPVALGYLANLHEMATDLTSRSPTPWIDFLLLYTYPKLYVAANAAYDYSDQTQSCLGAALLNEGKQLGEDIMDEVFSLGDAIAYQFHERKCAKSTEELQALKEEMELYLDPATIHIQMGLSPEGTHTISGEKVKALALEQAFAELEADDEMFGDFCKWMFKNPGDDNQFVEATEVWKELRSNFDRLKLCGLLDMMTSALQCLFSGLSLEEALGKMLEAALRAMSVKNLGNLFIGLPADKQAEIEALVKQKLAAGDVFKDATAHAAAADSTVGNYETLEAAESEDTSAPSLEEIPEKEKHDWVASHEGNYGGQTTGEWESWGEENRSTLAPGFFASTNAAAGSLDPNSIVGAYIKAILETYVGDELSLVDLLGNFPGAPIVSKILATVTCPSPAFFNPAIMDTFKDWELPICTNMKEITWPTLMLPPRHKFKDLWMMLKSVAKLELAKLIQRILVMLMLKLCEIVSKAICNALELVGDITAAAFSRENTIASAIRESICGDDISDEQLANTVKDLFDAFGNGGAAFADADQVMDFTMDISSAVTQDEMAEAFLGNASDAFLTVADQLAENEHPWARESFSDKQAIKKAFENMGNVMPVDFKDSLRAGLGGPGSALPSNPTLCATPEQLEDFCNARSALLEGRATPDQIKKQCDDFRDSLAADLGDLAPIMNDLPGYLQDNMPPLVSDPGCDNGILPYEPELVAEAISATLGDRLEQIKICYGDDMLGNGPGKKNWGLINMILSDTMGQPLTVHHRKTSNQKRRVDFNKMWTAEEFEDALKDLLVAAGLALTGVGMALAIATLMASLPPTIAQQRGAYPKYVAEWLREQINDLEVSYNVNNEVATPVERYFKNFEDLPGYSVFNQQKLNFLQFPDFGYNIDIQVDYANRYVKFIRMARKSTPDVTLEFRDNAKGIDDYEFAYGYDLEVYFADIEPTQAGLAISTSTTAQISNRSESVYSEGLSAILIKNPSDSTRIKIYNIFNPSVDFDNAAEELVTNPEVKKTLKKIRKDDGVTIKERSYEFISVDNTFDGIDLDSYPNFREAFERLTPPSPSHPETGEPPQLRLLKEILSNNDSSATSSEIEAVLNAILESVHSAIKTDVYENESPWLYGAQFDYIKTSDADYLIPDDTSFVDEEYWGGLYQDAVINNPDPTAVLPTRKILNDDMILGISRMQYEIDKGTYVVQYAEEDSGEATSSENRVFYLDPAIYGGTYMNPAIYIKPMINKGWLGLVDVLFPDLSVCKPSLTDLVDFEDIQNKIDDTYRTLPDDERLAKDPDCSIEVPYNRILERSSKSFIEGLISATIRIYCSVHIIKALSVFTKFVPKFPQVCSPIYASYIIESMETSLKDAQGAFWEGFNTFKDEEFWYAFLEQSVQMYARRIDSEELEPPPAAQSALDRLNKMQQEYEYPSEQDLKADKEDGKVPWRRFLKNYRYDKNLEAVQATEDDAKIILKELVTEQLNYMSTRIVENLDSLGMTPDVKDMDYYVLDNFTLQGTSEPLTLNEAVELDGSFEAAYPDLPTVPYEEDDDEDGPYYTTGGEFVIGEDYDLTVETKGQEYIGYYHVHLDEETRDVIYMIGEYHTDEVHTVLYRVVNLLHVPIGDVTEYGYGAQVILGTSGMVSTDTETGETSTSGASYSYTKPFLVEKYISIDGVKYIPDDAVTIIKSNDGEALLADIYPGTLEVVKNDDGSAIGITGEMGVRYGLEFSIQIEGAYHAITSVEMDPLDRPIDQFTTISANSGLLACLINHLRNDETFKLITGYIFPVKKIVSIMAIYADLGFLPSIGEVTVADGEAWASALNLAFDPETKPGMFADVVTEDDGDGNQIISSITIDSKVDGWASKDDRNVFSLGFLEFDGWDQELLRNSKAKIKRLFKSNYNDREFDIEELSGKRAGQLHLSKLKEALKFPSGERILPRLRRKRLISNPFNADGDLCEKEE